VNSQNRDVGTVHGAAHIQAAGQSDPHVVRQFHRDKIIIDFIHQGFDRSGSICCRRVAMNPSLRVNDIGNGMSRAADRII
jgi:hypothetical protein